MGIWVCCFCNNQFRILDEKSKSGADDLGAIFEQRLCSIGEVLIMLDGWHNPHYITRIWCIYETSVAVDLKLPATVICPRHSATSLIKEFQKGHIIALRAGLTKVDVQNAEASVAKDREFVKQKIASSVGFQAVNKAVVEFLTRWMVTQFELFLRGYSYYGSTLETNLHDVVHLETV